MSSALLAAAVGIGAVGALLILAAVVADINDAKARPKAERRTLVRLSSRAGLKSWPKAG
jgi:hypothetical protein